MNQPARYLQEGAGTTRKQYPACGKSHKRLSLHCSKDKVSPQTLQREKVQQRQLTATCPKQI